MNTKKIPKKTPLYLDGPKRGIKEIWFALKVGYSFMYNNYKLHNIGPGITVFGSARTPIGSEYYEAAREFGKRIAQMNFTTITGGGPGIMEAANKGAFEAKGRSIGMNIVLPHEQHENLYLTTSVIFEYFFTRKVMLVKHSYAFIIMPGGFGTMDEFFEIITLIQTKSTDKYPVILFGKKYYEKLVGMMHTMADEGTIAREDIDLIFWTDSIDDGMDFIQKFIHKNFNILPHRPRWRWLEKK
ncbi:Rossman fold protein, TIGR00730 family [Arachidicoccus ginsenosidimutans]|uniref:LOG family protein n=1 Tax=Arachidicoccus sp. BS20 TaxID=1850526 RepID=UPI0007F06626|nr:TIGR00730 family Rossman fold protein [Arachidicoccus sp. BS20]ANI88091.1 Rossman fold protein, TIGR00730 family [Arachidicoccus sp. BS20]